MTIHVPSGLTDRGSRYGMRGQRVQVVGTVRPFVAGQEATVEVFRGSRQAAAGRVPIRRSGGNGRFEFSFIARQTGTYTITARHDATAQQSAFAANRVRVKTVYLQAGPGSRGLKVRLLHRGLRPLGYVVPGGSTYGAATARAVLAFRKVNGMGRTTSASSTVYWRIFRGVGTFRLRHPRAGKHVEFDWSRQVLVLARRGRAERIYHASSGKSSTPTVFGSFRFYMKQPGYNSIGMLHSNYFIRGYAIHGYKSVPTYPASHGCIRVPIPNARSIDGWIKIGDRIFVYR